MRQLLAAIPAERPLGAVVHCAGALADGTVETLGSEQIDRVFAPKADSAWHLHELTAGADLTAFVLFSSVAGTLGGAGQANYAAANAFLDALAQRRRAAGLAATSIAWGLWQSESAMTSDLGEADLARMRRSGMRCSQRRGWPCPVRRRSAGRLRHGDRDPASTRLGSGALPRPASCHRSSAAWSAPRAARRLHRLPRHEAGGPL